MLTDRQTFPLILLIAVLFGGLLTACGRIQQSQPENADEVTLDMALEPDQPVVGSTSLIFTLTDQAGQPINNATLKVEGNMTHAGMTPVFGEASTGKDGRYVVPFEWTMGGDWFVTVDVTLPDGQEISREFPVTVSGNAGQ
jgi:hypothetical protein